MSGRIDRRAAGVAAAAVVLVGLVAWSLGRDTPEPVGSSWPSPEEMDSLSRYLAPVAPAPRVDDYGDFLPAAAARTVRAAPPVPVPPRRDWRLSAILIAGDRPTAIINDRQVRPGERLEGGAQVLSIERDRVIIQESDGARRTLRLSGNEGPNP